MSEETRAAKPIRRGGPMGGGPMAGMGAPVQKAKDFKGTLKNLLKYLKPFRLMIGLVVLFAVASTVFSIASPKILGHMTNQIVDDYIGMTAYDQIVSKLPAGVKLPAGTKGSEMISKMPASALSQIPADKLEIVKNLDLSKRPGINYGGLRGFAYLLLGLYLLSALFGYIQGWVMSGVSQRVTYNLRREISQKINRMPLRYFDKQTFGEVLSRVTNDVDTVSQSLNQSLSQIVTSVVTIIGILIMMLSINVLLTVVSLIILPLSFGLLGGIMKKSQAYFKGQQDSLGHLNGHVEEMYGGHTVMRVFNGEKQSVDKFEKINTKLYVNGWKAQFFSGLMFPVVNFVGNLGYVGVAVLGGYLAVQGKIKIGDIQAFIQYVQQFNQPIAQTANIANVMQSTIAASERVFEFLNEEEEILESSSPVIFEGVKGEVEFENVIFGYDPEKVIIKGFNAKIKPGQRVAIVGPTGAGKTTMVNLLMRFYDVDKGAIKVDGVDIRDIKRSDLRKMFGMVLQDTWLFNGTVRENIEYGNKMASDEEMISASKAAHVDHFVHSLPDGYDMQLNEEADNISQGEKQLLTIARAMLANPPILILDEATSSVDTRTEVLIQKAMENLLKGRTSFIIAHRLSTIRDADLILVMRDGNIVEQGNHSELMKNEGFYASLYNSQFAGSEE